MAHNCHAKQPHRMANDQIQQQKGILETLKSFGSLDGYNRIKSKFIKTCNMKYH